MQTKPDILDVTQFHFDISDVYNHSRVGYPFGRPENLYNQSEMATWWNKNRDRLHDRFFWSEEKWQAFKLERLRCVVDYAYANTNFYKKLYDNCGYEPGAIRSLADFEKLPTISRDDLIDAFPNDICSRSIPADECRRITSSGSSGKPVMMRVSQFRANLDIAFKYRQFEIMGNFRLAPTDWLYNLHHSLWWYTSFLGEFPVFTVEQDCSAEAIIEHIKRLRPAVVSSLASKLPELVAVSGSLRDYGVKLVTTNSESSSASERQSWEKILEVPVRDEYSSEEVDILGHQCHAGSYHCVEDDVHLEVLNQDTTGMGEVFGTDLWNLAMPVIRYSQGDLVKLSANHTCECGSQFRTIEEMHGRADQAFVTHGGQRIPPGSLLDLCDRHIVFGDAGIREYRLVQKASKDLQLLVVPHEPGAFNFDTQNFVAHLERLFGYQPVLKIDVLDAIPDAASYKRRALVSEVKSA